MLCCYFIHNLKKYIKYNIINRYYTMVEHICEKCNKIFYKKSSYINHINRKIKCNQRLEKIVAKSYNLNNYQTNKMPENLENLYSMCLEQKKCMYCNNIYSSKSSVINHIKNHCKKIKDVIKNICNEQEKKQKILKMQIEENNRLKKKNS